MDLHGPARKVLETRELERATSFILCIVFFAFWPLQTWCPLLTTFFSPSLCPSYSSPRRSYHRVLKFCMLCYIWPDKGCAAKRIPLLLMGGQAESAMHRPGNEDPHRCQRKLYETKGSCQKHLQGGGGPSILRPSAAKY